LSTHESNPNAYVLSDTTAQSIDTIKSWKEVYDIFEHEISNSLSPYASTEEDGDTFSTKLRHVVETELHKVVA
jgi:hypothetical protein